jgi:hypothetical protein
MSSRDNGRRSPLRFPRRYQRGTGANSGSFFLAEVRMRYVRMVSATMAILAAMAVTAAHAGNNTPNAIRYGKTGMTLGTWDGGPNQIQYSRTYANREMRVAPAPAVATTPSTGERRMFSAEPSTPPPVATAPANDGRRAFSAEPSTGRAAPAVGVMAAPRRSAAEYNRFGKGANSIGSTPPGAR